MFFNNHTHINSYSLQHDKQLAKAIISLDISLPKEQFHMLNNINKNSLFTIGIHPWNCHVVNIDSFFSFITEHAQSIIGIGECGLDKLSKVDFDLQEEVFVEQIKIANKINKPLIIHCVKAFNELINCLNLNDNKVPVIIHGFNNNENIARVMVNEGFYFSFGKALLGYESNAAKAIKNVGRKNFFLETDDADISIKYIYKKASELLGIDEDIIKQQIQSNFETVFKTKLF